MARPRKEEEIPGYVPFGSEQHRALLGLNNPKLSESDREVKEQSLTEEPKVVSVKRPITRFEFAGSTRERPGENIIDGWSRRGR